MIVILIITTIFITAFLINFFWEVLHSVFYQTCLKQNLKKNVLLLLRMSIIDSIIIILFYLLSFLFFKEINIFNNLYQLSFFIVVSILFSFFDEKISIKTGRWKYSKKMPTFLKVGVTPLLEIAVTGIITLWIVLNFMMII